MPRPRTVPIRNTALAARIDETGLPYRRIAAEVGRVAAENGYAVRCSAGVIANLLSGRTPVPDTVRVIVETFRRLLGAPHLTARDLGWEVPDDSPVVDPWGSDPVTWLAQLGRDDMADTDRRAVLFSLAATLPALALPAAQAARPRHGPAPGGVDAARIREMTAAFSDMDLRFGGGHARAPVAAYLTGRVVPVLRDASGRAGGAVFTAASELAYLAGFMAADDHAAGAAQRYYVQAFRLAGTAGDYRMRATVLRAMALQSVELGHPARGRDLAGAAGRALPAGAPERLRSWVTGMQAQAAAANGEAREARKLLRDAERHLERSAPHPSSWTGSYDLAGLQHQAGAALAASGDLAAAEEHLTASLTARGTGERRARALIGARLAVVQARRGSADAAARTVRSLTADLPMVDSARVHRELQELRDAWGPARGHAAVAVPDRAIADVLRVRGKARASIWHGYSR